MKTIYTSNHFCAAHLALTFENLVQRGIFLAIPSAFWFLNFGSHFSLFGKRVWMISFSISSDSESVKALPAQDRWFDIKFCFPPKVVKKREKREENRRKEMFQVYSFKLTALSVWHKNFLTQGYLDVWVG